MAYEKKKKEFKKNDTIFYPLQGVGVIRALKERDFKGEKTKYYDIYIQSTDMTIMIPTERTAELGIRKIVSKKQAEILLEKLAEEDHYVFSSDWKMRYQNSVDQIREGTLMDITKILRALYLRSKTKDLPIMERKLYDSSFRALIIELSLALKNTEEETRRILIKKFEVQPKD